MGPSAWTECRPTRHPRTVPGLWLSFLRVVVGRAWLGFLVLALAPAVAAAPTGAEAPSPVPALRQALALRDSGDLDAALAALDGLSEQTLADHVGLLRARMLRGAGRLEAALAAIERALDRDPPTELRASLYEEQAQIQLALGATDAAKRAQEAAYEATRDPQRAASLAFTLAEELDRRGFAELALEVYQTTWQRWPSARETSRAFLRSQEMRAESGAEQIPPGELLRLADRLRSRYRCDLALQLLDPLVGRKDLNDSDSLDARKSRASCLFQRRRYSEAAKLFAQLVRDDPSDLEAAVQEARARARSGQLRRAIRQLSQLTRTAPEKEVPRIRYLVSQLIEDRDPRSAARLLRLVAEQDVDRFQSRKARWELAWQALARSDWKDARRNLAPLADGPVSDIEVQRARYWHAVATLKLDLDEGRAALRALVYSVPITYYGILAAERLDEPLQIERDFIGERDPPPPDDSRPAERARWLIDSGLLDLARDELESWVRAGRLSRETRLVAAPLLHKVGEHYRATRLILDGFGDSLERGIDPSWRSAWQWAWPRPYQDLVRTAVEEFEFDAALVYAIMREESLYRPEIESPAGARGLMQIIPPTADRIARQLGIRDFNPEALYQPEVNVRFGTFYLKQLVRRFEGSQELAIAAYNAGPDAVEGWRRRQGALPTDRFVDSVPYGETRRYVRRVLRSYRVYNWLYGRKPQDVHASNARAQPGPSVNR